MCIWSQWVSVVLCLQACSFYAPYMLSKVCRNERLNLVLKEVQGLAKLTRGKEEYSKKLSDIQDYIADSMGKNNRWNYRMLLIDQAYLLNLVANLFATNRFINSFFFDYGVNVIAYFQSKVGSFFLP